MKVTLARPEHEPALRRLIAEDSMPGWIGMAYGREPDFSHGLGVEGPFTQTFVYLDRDGGVQGMGTRAVKPVWLDGEPADLGYLGGLRIRPEHRSGLGLARGFRQFRRLHGDGRCPFYVTTITADNEDAQRILTSGRAGLPHYLPAGRLRCQAVAPRWLARRLRAAEGLRLMDGAALGLEGLLAFFEAHGPRRQLFPRLRAQDFGGPYLRGLSLEDFVVVCDAAGEVQAVAALWDQRAFKQTLITGYALSLGLAMPLLRPILRWRTGLRLPRTGQELGLVFLAFTCLRRDDPALLNALLAEAGRRLEGVDVDALLLAFMDDDPLSPTGLTGVSYDSLVYLACWDEALERCRGVIASERPLHLEVASL